MKKLELAERTGLKREPELGWVQKLEEGSLALEEKNKIKKLQLAASISLYLQPIQKRVKITYQAPPGPSVSG